MEERLRSGGSSGVLVKNRNSLGCLIVKRKGDASTGDLGSSSSRKALKAKKAKKRPRMVLSDSGSSDELLVPPRRRVGTETIRICNDLVAYDKGFVEESATCKPRKWLDRMGCNEDIMICRNGLEESERRRSKLDVFDFNEYDGINGEIMRRKLYDDSGADFRGRRLMESMQVPQSGFEREFEAGSSRHVDRRKNLVFDRKSRMSSGERIGRSRYDINSDRPHLSLLRDKFIGNSDEAIRLQGKSGVLKVMVNKKKSLGGSLRNCNFQKTEKNRKVMRTVDMVRRSVRSSPNFSETEFLEEPASLVGTKNNMNSQKLLPTKNNKACDNSESEDSAASMKLEPDSFEACKSKKKVSDKGEDASCDHLNKGKEGKIRRGSGTEKQRLREKIRGMLLEAGWTIDYRPRRNRDYLDAVYINPSGTAYWSIIKAYDALQKQLNEEDNKVKPIEDGSFAPIADEILSQLTRKTRKKIEKEMKKKQRDEREIEKAKAAGVKKSTSTKRTADSDSHEEKLSSFIKQSGKSFKSSVNENGFSSLNSSGSNHHLYHDVEKSASGSSAPMVHRRKNRKLGRCTLLVRGSNKGFNSETDGFVPYTGKRTLLFWLIDSGSVQLSQKVQYMNRRRTRAMLEGWITRDGIHCGCCSKILTVSKFEIHAGSKLRQPYQNIYLDSGISLLQCQIDVWNRLVQSEQIGFHTVDIDGDDPNDDTCGMCADGGDLICCDSCPSTFHQNCLGIEMLPPGDWHCPNCTCKFCGANENVGEEDNISDSELFTCNLCEKKYHKSCVEGMDFSPFNANSLAPGFCGQKCKELFEHLQKYLGVRNDLEAGFSWSLIHRINENSETSHRGVPQKAECNSKLAVALTIMDECFLPIIDRRSGINLIRNVVYNCGSNFNRLNYGGFYTVVLERGDEIISAASIRFHGTKLAEMPYIGTRHIYRRQGMCRRLFGAIESALCSLKVEKLIIPAISELVHTWTTLFSFTPLEESLRKEMRSMNMLVFPGIDMLQKLIAPQEHETKSPTSIGMKQIECKDKQHVEPEVEVEKDADSSATHLQGDDDGNLCLANETTQEAGVVESGSQSLGVPLNDTSIRSVSLYDPRTTERILHLGSHSEAKLAGATSNDIEMQNEPKQSYNLKDSSFDASDDLKVQVSNEGTTLYDSQSGAKCISWQKCLLPSGTSHGVHLKDKLVLNFSSKDNTESLGVDDMDSSHKMNEKFDCLENVTASEENCNATEEVDEKVNNSTSLVMGNKERVLLVKSDLDYQNDFETGNNPNIDPEAASDGMNCEESALHASTDSSMVYALEGKFESRSI